MTAGLSVIFNRGLKVAKANAPEILTGLGAAGVPIVAYLSAQAGYKARVKLESSEDASIIDKTKLVWKCYIPPAFTSALTIGCVIGSSKASGRRTAAAVTAYSLTQKAFDEYKEHVIEEIGKAKEQKIKDKVVEKKVSAHPPAQLMILESGETICCELWTGRYFRSSMEKLKRAENEINAMIVNTYYVTLDDLYDILGLEHTSESDKLGWDTDKLLEFQFTSVLAQDGQPVLAFDYNYVRPSHRSIM